MQKRWVGLLLCFLAAAAFPATGRAEGPGDGGEGWVIVQYRAEPGAAWAGGSGGGEPLSTTYRSVPVPQGVSPDEFAALLRLDPGVVSAQADATVYASGTPNDPYYSTEQASYLGQIGAPRAWDTATGRNTVTVAVLDTGLDLGHEDFAGRLWENPADANSNGIDDDGNGCIDDRYGCRFINLDKNRERDCGYTSSERTGAVTDDHGKPGASSHSHGTMVSGIIGAAGNNGTGVAGIAWDVRIMAIKVLDCGTLAHGGLPSGEMFNVAEGIRYAQRMGAHIINLSLASAPGDQKADNPALREAIQSAQSAGILIVTAAGNHGSNPSQPGPGYPAAYTQFPNVVAVGSFDNTAGNTWATFSAYGPAIDFAAPGYNIASTTRMALGGYGRDKGTSYSTPLVTGMFALMMVRNSGLSYTDFLQIAASAASPAPPASHGQNWAGAGIINIGAALDLVPMAVTGTPMHNWKDLPPGTEVRATVDGTECGSTTAFGFGPVTRFALKVKAATEAAGCGAPGKTVQLHFGGTPALPTLVWGGLNVDLSVINKDISTVSPDPGAIVVQPLGNSWSNIAHLDSDGPLPNALSYLPNNWVAAMKWNPGSPGEGGSSGFLVAARGAPTYVSNWPAIQRYAAIWIDAVAANVATLNPNPAPGRTVQLMPGWNNIVYTGTSRSVSDALASMAGKYAQVMQFDNATGTWLSHIPGRSRYLNDFGGLLKLQVYWILVTQPATLTMD
ncbi:MAG: S8 family serine peptidase [Dehalococcoidia bacterium]|nr:S8 family serine peptidase [Dehalococcoidia bacterium]